MRTRLYVTAVAAASLGLAACTDGDDSQGARNTSGPVSTETMGENATIMNDMTTANDVAISNDL